MRHPAFKLGPLPWALCACLLLLSRAAAAAEPSLSVDFDGDGRHDTVKLDRYRPSVLRIWLSASGTTQVLVSRRPVHHVAATDLDGDHRPELIASDSQLRLQIWTPRARGFRRYQPRQSIPRALTSPTKPRVDGRNREPEEVLTGLAFGPSALSRTEPLTPSAGASRVCVAHREATCTASPAARPFSPRPPPV
jgi:hypothetical protein